MTVDLVKELLNLKP
jgi:hypothetical protein